LDVSGSINAGGQIRFYESVGTAASAIAGSLILEHGDASGVSSIVFKSKNNLGSDYGYIQYYDNYDRPPEYTGTNSFGISENSMLMIGVENDAGSGAANKDRIVLWSCNGTGFVGINNRRPAYALDVYGDVNAFSYNATSDYRIKTDVKSLDASFNVDVLKPVTYTNTRHGRKDVGFIAHEVQEHYPFLVNGEKDGENMQSLNYIGLIGILTKEIQDLKRRLTETEAKVASVETDVRTIETKVEEVGDIIISVEDTVLSVKNTVSSVENTVQKVENTVQKVENTVQKVENTVLLEQARLTICETDIALNKSAIKDLDERFQS
jgi:methyl-accepting chemotaxis protein